MNALKLTVVFVAVFSNVYLSVSVKVCSTWIDYYKFLGDNTCRDNLDDNDEFTGIVGSWGKRVQSYQIITDDGYNITLFRIVPENENANPVLLLHGTFMNSLAFVIRGKKSLAHQYVKEGYDVWFINWRGTKYSKRHKSLSSKEADFWKFSFHEWGTKDLPAALLKIKKYNPRKVLLVGFEIGTTAAFVYAIENPNEAAKNLNGMVSLSPMTAQVHAGYAQKSLYSSGPFTVEPLFQHFYHGEIPATFVSFRAAVLCRKSGILVARLCDLSFEVFGGHDLTQQDPETLPVIVAQDRDSDSVMMHKHINQLFKSKRFRKFDYGQEKNWETYGSSSPPDYNLSKINVPQLFFVGKNDKYGDLKDATVIYQQLDKAYQREFYIIDYEKFGLADFVQAKDINSLLHAHMMECVTKLVPPTQTST